MDRKIFLDTETTGFRPEDGHRIVEFGGVEVIDGVKTGKTLQIYMNPEKHMDEAVIKVHGITNEQVKDAPKFKDVADEIIDFIRDAELLIHNADFDVKFLNSEFARAHKGTVWDYAKKITCTVEKSKSIDAKEKKHNLDALCKRYGVSTERREFHGALLDSELLADAYLKMTEGMDDFDQESLIELKDWVRPEIVRIDSKLKLAKAQLSPDDEQKHGAYLQEMESTSKTEPVWGKKKQPPTPR